MTDEYIIGLFHIHIISVESIIETDEVLPIKVEVNAWFLLNFDGHSRMNLNHCLNQLIFL